MVETSADETNHDRPRCPVCRSGRVEGFLHRQGVPVHQNLLLGSAEVARSIPRGDLDLALCHECGFVHNRAFDASLLSYGASYDNTQTHSPTFEAYVDDLVRELVEVHGVVGSRVVEVGCGKGTFLRKLVEYPVGNTGVGFDPAYVGPPSDLDGRLRFETRFFDETCSEADTDVVVCRHVIEHVEDPVELLRTLRRSLVRSPGVRVFFETPCVEWILRNRVVWDLFYEHCSLFSAASLGAAFEEAGFRVERVRHVFGGQYLWLEAVLDAPEARPVHDAGAVPELATEYARDANRGIACWRERLHGLRREGRVAIWGAGAKGVTFANLVDPGRELVECVVDLNPQKQGRFVPGTGHPIVDYRRLPDFAVSRAVVMNPNYLVENSDLLMQAGLDIQLISEP
jgi:SAM-dependent methyltransferase